MDWTDVRHFLALARCGSVRAAGASLGVSHSTVARRVEALEARLSTRLFDRTRDGYALTEAGRRMLPGAEHAEQALATMERDLFGQDDRLEGRVSLTCFDGTITALLFDELADFFAAQPGIELTVTTDARPFDLSKREADVAVRVLRAGTQPPQHLIGTHLAPFLIASYVAIAHADRRSPDRPGATPRWVGVDPRPLMERLVAESSYPELPIWGTFTSVQLLTQAARRGFGVAMLPTFVGDADPQLRRLANPDARHVADLWLLSHADLRDNARFRATRAAIRGAFGRRLPLFRGDGCPTDAPTGPENAPTEGRGTAIP